MRLVKLHSKNHIGHLKELESELEELTRYSLFFLKKLYKDKAVYQINNIIRKTTMIYRILHDLLHYKIIE
jgi:hypothetical protein